MELKGILVDSVSHHWGLAGTIFLKAKISRHAASGYYFRITPFELLLSLTLLPAGARAGITADATLLSIDIFSWLLMIWLFINSIT